MKCSHCGAEFEGNFCTACGAKAEPCPQPSPEIPADRPRSQKPKKPIYKKWWFYVIVAVVVIAIAGRISGGSKSEKIDWDDMVLGAQLPQPPAKKGQIHTNTADELWVDIEKISDKQYADYVQPWAMASAPSFWAISTRPLAMHGRAWLVPSRYSSYIAPACMVGMM